MHYLVFLIFILLVLPIQIPLFSFFTFFKPSALTIAIAIYFVFFQNQK
jgi:hypothetical protein